LAHWPKKVVDKYEAVVRLCGGKFSAGKHFKSVDRGCFTENLFRVKTTLRLERINRETTDLRKEKWPSLDEVTPFERQKKIRTHALQPYLQKVKWYDAMPVRSLVYDHKTGGALPVW